MKEGAKLFPASPLKGRELFKYRQGLEKTLPEKGGQKEYSPDGTWLQAKRLEKFYEEIRPILKEPRVQRSCDIVHGEWNPEKRVVEIEQEMGKFWMKMGFIECQRKCLYPEEALFLLETGSLEVLWGGVPVSIQEAYRQFLDPSFTLEMYQVYAHLCRIGYVVIRHQGRDVFTAYERQLRLDTYVSKKKRKRQKAEAAAQATAGKSDVEESVSQSSSLQDRVRSGESEDLEQPSPSKQQRLSDTADVRRGNLARMDESESENRTEAPSLQAEPSTIQSSQESSCTTMDYADSHYYKQEVKLTESVEPKSYLSEHSGSHNKSKWDFSEICFPDFSHKFSVTLKRPDSTLLPENVVLSQECYTEDMLKGMGNYSTWYENEEELSAQRHVEELHDLEFSFERQLKKPRSWAEYKSMNVGVTHLFPHLYCGDVKPLCSPEDAVSTASILGKLQVIQEHKPSRRASPPAVLPDFDVYAPNTKFRKSCPGLPDRRIKVLRSTDAVPDLFTIRNILEYLDDKVSLLWAVVDHGSISFYDVDLISLPVDISLG